jgi:hypothetical protein
MLRQQHRATQAFASPSSAATAAALRKALHPLVVIPIRGYRSVFTPNEHSKSGQFFVDLNYLANKLDQAVEKKNFKNAVVDLEPLRPFIERRVSETLGLMPPETDRRQPAPIQIVGSQAYGCFKGNVQLNDSLTGAFPSPTASSFDLMHSALEEGYNVRNFSPDKYAVEPALVAPGGIEQNAGAPPPNTKPFFSSGAGYSMSKNVAMAVDMVSSTMLKGHSLDLASPLGHVAGTPAGSTAEGVFNRLKPDLRSSSRFNSSSGYVIALSGSPWIVPALARAHQLQRVPVVAATRSDWAVLGLSMTTAQRAAVVPVLLDDIMPSIVVSKSTLAERAAQPLDTATRLKELLTQAHETAMKLKALDSPTNSSFKRSPYAAMVNGAGSALSQQGWLCVSHLHGVTGTQQTLFRDIVKAMRRRELSWEGLAASFPAHLQTQWIASTTGEHEAGSKVLLMRPTPASEAGATVVAAAAKPASASAPAAATTPATATPHVATSAPAATPAATAATPAAAAATSAAPSAPAAGSAPVSSSGAPAFTKGGYKSAQQQWAEKQQQQQPGKEQQQQKMPAAGTTTTQAQQQQASQAQQKQPQQQQQPPQAQKPAGAAASVIGAGVISKPTTPPSVALPDALKRLLTPATAAPASAGKPSTPPTATPAAAPAAAPTKPQTQQQKPQQQAAASTVPPAAAPQAATAAPAAAAQEVVKPQQPAKEEKKAKEEENKEQKKEEKKISEPAAAVAEKRAEPPKKKDEEKEKVVEETKKQPAAAADVKPSVAEAAALAAPVSSLADALASAHKAGLLPDATHKKANVLSLLNVAKVTAKGLSKMTLAQLEATANDNLAAIAKVISEGPAAPSAADSKESAAKPDAAGDAATTAATEPAKKESKEGKAKATKAGASKKKAASATTSEAAPAEAVAATESEKKEEEKEPVSAPAPTPAAAPTPAPAAAAPSASAVVDEVDSNPGLFGARLQLYLLVQPSVSRALTNAHSSGVISEATLSGKNIKAMLRHAGKLPERAGGHNTLADLLAKLEKAASELDEGAWRKQ